jgi:hypothetical protein
LKYDNKISISLYNSSFYSASERFSAKKLANEIVVAGFEHPAIVGDVVKSDKKLINTLKENTKELKDSYIEKVLMWSNNRFNFLLEKNNWSDEKWCDFLDIKYIYDERLGRNICKDSYKLRKHKLENQKKVGAGLQKFLEDATKNAEAHYESSILKLSERLKNKGFTESSNFEILTSGIGINIEMVIKHDDKITKAWTIVAEGEIQAPHYRYLVK